jgi:hypothetical protein
MLIFGALGYLLLRSNCERGLLLIAFTMGPLLEENIRRAMLLARGDFQAILARPIVAAMLVTALVLGFIGRKLLYRSPPGAEPVPVLQPAVRVPAPPLNWGRVIVVGLAAFAFVPIVAMQLMMIAGAPRDTIGPVTLVSQLAVLALIVAYVRRRRSARQ